ncbi:EpsG family protein [Harryflintia acetispora]|uniref:EpsG family protein n=1 Tax=Harryflintia acetispora TaxID=1849041 RepID=UPI001897C7DA|nr:EpsG family protein [Harryflintia acetispora]
MLIYILNLVLILALAWPLCIHKPTPKKKLCYLAVTFGALFLLAALRQGIGNDYDTYIEIYQRIGATPVSQLWAMPEEKGYVLLCKLLSLISMDTVFLYAVMALLCLVPVAWFIYRYSPNVWLSTWLYVTLTFFYGTMNFVRQNLAVAILLLGFPLLRRRKIPAALCYAGVILLACTFHKSAVIMLPILLVCYIPLKKWVLGTYAGLALALYVTSGYIIDFITDYIYTQYKGKIYLELGFGFHFLIVPALILLLALCTQKKVTERYPDGGLMVNMMLYSFLIWLFITKHFVLERFSLYVYIFVLLAVPMACETFAPDNAMMEKYQSLREELRQARSLGGKSPKLKSLSRQFGAMKETVALQQVYYWCVVGAVLVATFCYQVFGMYDGTNGFHGVFPYHSFVGFLERLP